VDMRAMSMIAAKQLRTCRTSRRQLGRWVRPVQGDTSLVGELPKAARQDTKFSNVLLMNRDLLRLLRLQDRPLRSSSNAAQPCRECTLVREPPAVIGT
jgi:hypothetical protein